MAAIAVLALAGCQSVPPYHPKADGSYGYSDQQLAANRYRVTFAGNYAAKRTDVEDFLLLRAAEVTLKAGYRYFEFDTRDTEPKTQYRSDFLGGPDWPVWRRPGFGWYWHSWPAGPGGEIDATPVTRYEAYAEIVLLTGEQAKSEARALDAEDVVKHIGPKIKGYPQ